METPSDETHKVRRTMRDLVAISALPAIWVGYQPRQMAESLADLLLNTLSLEFVYLRLRGPTDGQEIEVARSGRPPEACCSSPDAGKRPPGCSACRRGRSGSRGRCPRARGC
jgi:hypothetical protein